MNKLLVGIIKISFIIIAFIIIHFRPYYWIDIIFAVSAAFLVEYLYKNSRIYSSLKWLQMTKEKFRTLIKKRKLKKIIEREQYERYKNELINNAFEKALSSSQIERKIGLEQLSQFGADETYEKLLNIIKNGLNKEHEIQIIKVLCDILNNMEKHSNDG